MITKAIKRQYGLWDSPIKPINLARGISFSDVAWDHDGTLVWLESRSDRGVLVLQMPNSDAPRDLNSDLSIRARVGYGGGDFTVGHGWVYFVEDQSGRLYRQPTDQGTAHPITPAFGNYASPSLSPDGNWLTFVHTYDGEDGLGIVDSQGLHWPQKLTSGDDFYMQPVWKPNNNEKQVALIAWIAWNHPNMPWNGTDLHLGKLDLSSQPLPTLSEDTTLAGGSSTSVFQPEFSPDGRFLAYVSDASGWWQLYLFDLEKHQHRQLTSSGLCPTCLVSGDAYIYFSP